MSSVSRTDYGVLFDMDGVLVDSAVAHWQAWTALGEEQGVPFARSLFESTFGMHNQEIIPLWLGGDVSAEEISSLSQRKEAIYRERAAECLEALPGVVELVKNLFSNGFRVAVASSGPRANVELILDLLGVREYFAALSTGDDVRNGKPHPEVFEVAAARLDLPPERCVVIEDAPQGIEAGRRAGARVVAVTSSRPAEDLQRADVVVGSLADLDADSLRRLLDDPGA